MRLTGNYDNYYIHVFTTSTVNIATTTGTSFQIAFLINYMMLNMFTTRTLAEIK